MQRPKGKWRADHDARVVRNMHEIEASVTRLNDEDLLDLHDIFAGDPGSPLDILAAAEMSRRDLKP
jgi:hypothetical protein